MLESVQVLIRIVGGYYVGLLCLIFIILFFDFSKASVLYIVCNVPSTPECFYICIHTQHPEKFNSLWNLCDKLSWLAWLVLSVGVTMCLFFVFLKKKNIWQQKDLLSRLFNSVLFLYTYELKCKIHTKAAKKNNFCQSIIC